MMIAAGWRAGHAGNRGSRELEHEVSELGISLVAGGQAAVPGVGAGQSAAPDRRAAGDGRRDPGQVRMVVDETDVLSDLRQLAAAEA